MKTYACRYAVVQFVPYTETEEFANVGVVLACPEAGVLDFKLQTRRVRRVTAFFDELPGNVYRHAVRVFQGELERVKEIAAQDRTSAGVRDLFKALIHPREAIVRFGRERVVLADDPAAELQRLYAHYVERSFATPEYVEVTIEKRLRAVLNRVTPDHPFRAERVGDEDYYANFPLVQKVDGVMRKVIKPFNLGHEQTVDIYEHGEKWIAKIKHLRRKSLLPDDILFAVSPPAVDDIRRRTAADEICTELAGLGVQTLDQDADDQITHWALSQGTQLQ